MVGVSVDDTTSHANFAKKYNLPFPLLADNNGETAYVPSQVWQKELSELLLPLQFSRKYSDKKLERNYAV